MLTKEKFIRIEKRLKSVPKGSKSVRIVMNTPKVENKFTVKTTVKVKGKKYFSDDTNDSLEHAIIGTVNKILRMMNKDNLG